MAEPSPPQDAGQEPDQEAGQAPEQGASGAAPSAEPRQPRTYSESYVRDLRKEAADARARARELEEANAQYADRDKTEFERLTDKATVAEQRAAEAEAEAARNAADLLRFKIAGERGLPMKVAHLLTGSTREEIELRADELSETLQELLEAQGFKPTTGFDGGARPLVAEPKTAEEAHQQLLADALRRR